MPAVVENVGKTIGNCTTSVTYHPRNKRTQNVELRTCVLLLLERARLRAFVFLVRFGVFVFLGKGGESCATGKKKKKKN